MYINIYIILIKIKNKAENEKFTSYSYEILKSETLPNKKFYFKLNIYNILE